MCNVTGKLYRQHCISEDMQVAAIAALHPDRMIQNMICTVMFLYVQTPMASLAVEQRLDKVLP